MAFSDTVRIKYKFTLGRRVLTVYSWNLTPAVHLIRTRLLIRLKFGDGLGKRTTTLEYMPQEELVSVHSEIKAAHC